MQWSHVATSKIKINMEKLSNDRFSALVLVLFRFELVIFVVFVPMFEVCCCVSVRREKEIN